MDKGNAKVELFAPVRRGRGRPRLDSDYERAAKVRRDLARDIATEGLPEAYRALKRLVGKTHELLDTDGTVKREHYQAVTYMMGLGGVSPATARREEGSDIVEMSLAEIDAFLRQGQALMREREEALRDITPKPSSEDIEKLM